MSVASGSSAPGSTIPDASPPPGTSRPQAPGVPSSVQSSNWAPSNGDKRDPGEVSSGTQRPRKAARHVVDRGSGSQATAPTDDIDINMDTDASPRDSQADSRPCS
ncbi:hypothetical protein BJX70DRAFT_310682 [Aspergillus crustosus]